MTADLADRSHTCYSVRRRWFVADWLPWWNPTKRWTFCEDDWLINRLKGFSFMLWARRTGIVCNDSAHLLMTSPTGFDIDSPVVHVTPRIFIDKTRAMSDNGSVCCIWCLRCQSTKTIFYFCPGQHQIISTRPCLYISNLSRPWVNVACWFDKVGVVSKLY